MIIEKPSHMASRILKHDTIFWRRLAYLGAAHGPEWWVRYSPAFFGLAAAAVLPHARSAVVSNLKAIRGDATKLRDLFEMGHTFTSYAGCLAEVLSNGSKNHRVPYGSLYGRENFAQAAARGRGVILVTIHSGGWDNASPLLAQGFDRELMFVMRPERDPDARALQDAARQATGIILTHVGHDALASLPLLRHLRAGNVVGLQVDRVPEGVRAREVTLLDKRSIIPEGPLRLAQVSGSPIVPVFCARVGYRRYQIEAHAPIEVPRRATEDDIDRAAQRIADAVTSFLRAFPTQWFHFGMGKNVDAPDLLRTTSGRGSRARVDGVDGVGETATEPTPAGAAAAAHAKSANGVNGAVAKASTTTGVSPPASRATPT